MKLILLTLTWLVAQTAIAAPLAKLSSVQTIECAPCNYQEIYRGESGYKQATPTSSRAYKADITRHNVRTKSTVLQRAPGFEIEANETREAVSYTAGKDFKGHDRFYLATSNNKVFLHVDILINDLIDGVRFNFALKKRYEVAFTEGSWGDLLNNRKVTVTLTAPAHQAYEADMLRLHKASMTKAFEANRQGTRLKETISQATLVAAPLSLTLDDYRASYRGDKTIFQMAHVINRR